LRLGDEQEWYSHPIRSAIRILSKADRKKLVLITVSQALLGILDLVGIGIFGILGALSITGIESKPPGGKIQAVLNILQLDQLQFQTQVGILATLSAILLVGRTALSAVISRRTFKFLSLRGANISIWLANAVLREPLIRTQKRVVQNVIFGITGAVNSLVLGVIGSLVSLVADTSLLILIVGGLLFVDISLAIGTCVFFGLIGLTLHRIMHTNASKLGAESSKLQISINSLLSESIVSKREIYVRDRFEYYVGKVSNEKFALAYIEAKQAFLPNVSKYVLESSVFVGALLISGYQFLSQDAVHAIGNLTIFLAAGMRIAPAVLRVQQGFLSIKGHSGAAIPAMELISEFDSSDMQIESIDVTDPNSPRNNFFGACSMTGVNFRYSDTDKWSLTDINIDVKNGSFVALVGSSGAGKTTVVDLLLGLINPDSGQILISGQNPAASIHRWPGSISYVPQEVTILNATFAENVALGFSKEELDMDRVMHALAAANLNNFVSGLENGILTVVGERGLSLSGGQKQRLGIARALYTMPMLIILDEATSSLDAETENLIGQSLQALHGEVTVIAIAHRLSTIRLADKVIYLENGRILAQGTFEEVRVEVPNFDNQAKLLGL